ncbi:YggT family protein [Weissella halotolerans]|uniref:YggT family protein n=1 Tax=Weissella halotolerans DSM 20190 TaxID=1123500 RepID=A0A0R2FZX0_9LACO|nr:YggT family protein [Weissella halotolerans]KRN31749.1 hypothetical protein IV68_GL001005 [Weissella halotolerans DSM 20190]
MGIIITILMGIVKFFEVMIIISALMSWLPGAQQSKLGSWISQAADIILDPIRRFMPRAGMFDFSPIIGILILQAADYGIMAIIQILMGQ